MRHACAPPKSQRCKRKGRGFEREADSYDSSKKSQNDVGSKINEKIIIVTPASEMWQKGVAHTHPHATEARSVSGERMPPPKNAAENAEVRKSEARPRLTKRKRTEKPTELPDAHQPTATPNAGRAHDAKVQIMRR